MPKNTRCSPTCTLPDPAHDAVLSNELPADVINGKVDYIEVIGFSDHKATAQVWYRLLNLGFHLPTGAGTDAMANYTSTCWCSTASAAEPRQSVWATWWRWMTTRRNWR